MKAAIIGAFVLLVSAEAFAQQGRRGRVPPIAPQEEPAGRAAAQPPRNLGRNVPRYDQQGSGIIRWNTPNADGNLGTPSGGGGGGP